MVLRLKAKPGQGDKMLDVVNDITPDSISKPGAGAFELSRRPAIGDFGFAVADAV